MHANAVKTNAPSVVFWDRLRSFCTTPSRHPPQDGPARRLAVTPMTMYDMTAIERRRAKKPTLVICESLLKNGPKSRKRPALTTLTLAATTEDVPLDLD